MQFGEFSATCMHTVSVHTLDSQPWEQVHTVHGSHTANACGCHTSLPLGRAKAGGRMHVGVSLQSASCLPHWGHFSIMLQQDGVIGHVGVARPRGRGHVLLQVHAVLLKLHGRAVQMRGGAAAWHEESPRDKLQHKVEIRESEEQAAAHGGG